MKNRLLSLSAISAILILNACGGSNTDPVVEPKPNTTTLSGTAVDELILNGKVLVSKPDGTKLAEGRTDSANGTYTLKIEVYTGPVIVNVTCDSDSKLQLSTGNAECPSNLNLNSVTNIEANSVPLVVNISPLTQIVYKKAMEVGINKDSIKDALNKVGLTFGVNPLSDNPTADTYAKVIKSFHTVAENNSSMDLFDVIDAFIADFSDGNISNSKALIDAMKNTNITNNLTNSDSSYVVPDNAPDIDNVTKVKDMIKSLRTQATTIEDFANPESENIGTALDNVTLDLQSASDYVVAIIEIAGKARDNGQSSSTEPIEVNIDGKYFSNSLLATVTQSSTNPDEWSYTTSFVDNTYTGKITMPEITDGIEKDFTTLSAKLDGTLPYVKDIYSNTPNIGTQTVKLNDLTLTKTTDGTYMVLSGLSIENGTKVSVDEIKGSIGYTPNDGSEPTFNYVKIDSIKLSASTGVYAINGMITPTDYKINNSIKDRGGFGDEVNTDTRITISCEGLNVWESSLTLDGKIYSYNYYNYDYYNNMGNKVFGYSIRGNFSEEAIKTGFTSNATCNNGATPNIKVYNRLETEEVFGNSGYIPSKISFVGSLKNTATGGEINGTINAELRNSESINLKSFDHRDGEKDVIKDIDAKIVINGTLVMPDRPKTLLNLSYETDMTNKKHTIAGSYSYENTLMTMSGNSDMDLNVTNMTFTNGSDITATFKMSDKDGFISGNLANNSGSLISVDGSVVASIEDRGNDMLVVKYLDGYFESIF